MLGRRGTILSATCAFLCVTGACGGENGCGGSGASADADPCETPPETPAGPIPPDGANDVDWTLSAIDWGDAADAAAYDVYLGTCPVPSHPDAAFSRVVSSRLAGFSLSENTEYCWQVVSVEEEGCATPGPVWTFHTSCAEAGVNPPRVISPTEVDYPFDEASGTYQLRFNKSVRNVDSSLTWSPVVGTGTMGAATQVAADLYDVPFSGVADGDSYNLEVATTVEDTCGVALAEPVTISLNIGCWPAEAECEDGDLCTVDDACAGGVCVGAPVDCEDLVICTAEECEPSTGLCEVTDVDPIGRQGPTFALADANQHSASYGLAIDPITDAAGKVRVLAFHSCG